jgi:general secretion pathway protein N
MRFDSAGPLTWLLAAIAGWAVVVLLLAVFGLGGRISTLPEDATMLRDLSDLPRPAAERLGPLGQYAETASRPLFADDRRPHAFSLQPGGAEGQAKAFDFVLTSVMITPDFKMAIIQAPDGNTAPLRIRLGEGHESLPNWRLDSIDARSAVFVGPEGERRLDLRIFNGVGGEPPTAMASPNQRPSGRPVQPPRAQAPAVVTDANQIPVEPPPQPEPAPAARPGSDLPSTPMTEQAQMDAIRKRIEARRAQLRQEAQQEQQRQNQKPPVK